MENAFRVAMLFGSSSSAEVLQIHMNCDVVVQHLFWLKTVAQTMVTLIDQTYTYFKVFIVEQCFFCNFCVCLGFFGVFLVLFSFSLEGGRGCCVFSVLTVLFQIQISLSKGICSNPNSK